MKGDLNNPVTDINEYKEIIRKQVKEINENIYVYYDSRELTLQFLGRMCLIKEHHKNHTIEIYFLYNENPDKPIDDSDTGSGYYPASKKDYSLARKVESWYKNIYLKGKYNDVKLPDIIYFKRSDDVVTNYPER